MNKDNESNCYLLKLNHFINIMNAKSNPYETIIYAIVVVVTLAFAIINTTIQMMLSKYNSRCELEELQKGTNDDSTLFL